MTNIKRNAHIALATVVTTVGLSSTAMAFGPAQAPTTLGTGPAQPSVAMTHKQWKHCWSLTYANWRKDGGSIQGAQAAADLTCGTQP